MHYKEEYIKKLLDRLTKGQIDSVNIYLKYLIVSLSVRGRNSFYKAFNGNPTAIEIIHKIYSPKFNFSSIRGLGVIAVKELDNFIESLLQFIINLDNKGEAETISINKNQNIINDIDEKITKILSEFKPFEKAVLNLFIENLLSDVQKRNSNALEVIFGHRCTSEKILDTLFYTPLELIENDNIGNKIVFEYNYFKSAISSFIEEIALVEKDQLAREYVKLLLTSNFYNNSVKFNEEFDAIFDKNGKIKLFKLIYLIIHSSNLLNYREKIFFSYLFYESNTHSLSSIANNFKIGENRIKQLLIIFEEQVQNHFRFTENLNLEYLVDYGFSYDTVFKIIDKDFIENINKNEDVEFTISFYKIIFNSIVKKSHSMMDEVIFISEKHIYKKAELFNHFYLIHENIYNFFRLKEFSNDIRNRLSGRIKNSYSLNFENYLLQFIEPEGIMYLLNIKEISKVILSNDFNLNVNNAGYILIESNVRKTLNDYTFEILEELGKMANVEEILKAMYKKYPQLSTTEQSIRKILSRKDLYIYIGRSSTYGLKKWELEDKTLKGGTIRDIVEDYLKRFDKPQHSLSILNYVKQFRNTSDRNILSNIRAEVKNRFVFFEGGYIGLKSKNYSR